MNRNRRIQAAALTLSAGIMFAGASINAQAAPLAGASATILEAAADDSASGDVSSQVTGTGSTLSGVNRVLAEAVSDTSDELDEEEQKAEEDKAAEEALMPWGIYQYQSKMKTKPISCRRVRHYLETI